MNKIFSAVALAATVVTLTLASADVLASSGKGKDAKGSSHNTSQSSGPGKSSGKGNGSEKSKGHNHNHSNGKGHDHHQGNGYGHDHDDDDEDGSCEADGSGNGHQNHKGKGHQHEHIGYINGVGHHKHHDHDDDDCGGGDNGGGGGGVVLPEGCYAGAAWVTLADYTVYDGFKEATEIAVQSEDNTLTAWSSFTFIEGLGAIVGVTPEGDLALHEFAVYTDIDGVETEIFSWQAPTDGGVLDVVTSGNEETPLNITSEQFDAGIGVITLICEAGVIPGTPN